MIESIPEIGLSAVVGVLPPATASLEGQAADGRLVSRPDVLADFGFEAVHVCDHEHDSSWLVETAAQRALEQAALEPGQIDLVVWASALAEGHVVAGDRGSPSDPGLVTLRRFRYPACRLQERLSLDGAEVLAVGQQGCVSMFTAMRTARSLLLTESRYEHALCVGVDVLSPTDSREMLYNVISDAACAVVLSRGGERDRWVDSHQLSRGYYWDPTAMRPEILAAYFPTSRLVIRELLDRHGLAGSDVDHVVATGVQRQSWDVLLELCEIPVDRLVRPTVPFGHTILADSCLVLEEMRRTNTARRGARILLFAYGFGSHWSAILLEH